MHDTMETEALAHLAAGDGLRQFFSELSLPMIILFVAPFALLLLSIAILPLAAPHFWEHNRNKGIVAAVFGAPIALFFLIKDWHAVLHTGLEYAAFISLLASLFVISGGIYVRGAFAGLPRVNTAFMAIGAVLANFVGTTGASMLLIRPILRANARRKHKAHVIIFFILIVSNCGGCLTPLGDPPLFLGFLRGVPFLWTLRLVYEWAFVVGALLIVFFAIDRFRFRREEPADQNAMLEDLARSKEKFGLEGSFNLFFLLGVIGTILFSGYVIYPRHGELASMTAQAVIMGILAFVSHKVTPRALKERNGFTFHPIVEVAALFAGIFAAMMPALIILEVKGRALGVTQPWQYFWTTGALSGFLDNAPTYLTFTSLAKSVMRDTSPNLHDFSVWETSSIFLAAISTGAVFMGALTYIGNGPNFMVKAIAEEARIRMPSFFGYMVWSVAILIPILIVVTLVFFTKTFDPATLQMPTAPDAPGH
jgi:Na+/H+ antiporter NhaD/arsenite permease-like protein